VEPIVKPRSYIHVGDIVEIHNRSDNAALKKGFYHLQVIEEDDHSLAVASFGAWWFYRDTGQAYSGDAVIVSKV
jgi:hypothetical protein